MMADDGWIGPAHVYFLPKIRDLVVISILPMRSQHLCELFCDRQSYNLGGAWQRVHTGFQKRKKAKGTRAVLDGSGILWHETNVKWQSCIRRVHFHRWNVCCMHFMKCIDMPWDAYCLWCVFCRTHQLHPNDNDTRARPSSRWWRRAGSFPTCSAVTCGCRHGKLEASHFFFAAKTLSLNGAASPSQPHLPTWVGGL